jgi:nucleoside 2-deoxyribosyltransferase
MSIRIYIAGPITGTKDDNRPEFDNAEAFLSGLGLEVLNPLKNGIQKDAPWVEHMKADIQNMLKCDAVYALNGWHNSKGARAEIQLAEALDMPIFEQCEKDNIKLGLFKKEVPRKSILTTRETFEPKFPHQTPDNAYKFGQTMGQTEQSKGLNQYAGGQDVANKAAERKSRLYGQAEAMFSIIKKLRRMDYYSVDWVEIEKIINAVEGL